MATSPEDCARALLDVVPLVTRTMRRELRRHRSAELSLPQFRALAYLDRQPNASLSELGEHIGLSLSSTSKMVDGLVARGLVRRADDPADRRRVVLCLTEDGQGAIERALAATETYLAGLVGGLTEDERTTVARAMQVLRPVFGPDCQAAALYRDIGG